MKTLAIIAEYNPFHNGHKYHLDQSLQATDADYAVTIMSGNFLQRGHAAITDKYSRGKMCVLTGIDLALELPFPYASGSALDFSMGAISTLNKLNSIDYLCFGAETPDLSMFYKIVDVILEEPDKYKNSLKNYLSEGYSYPVARNNALNDYCNNTNITEFVSTPNNILGIEYVSALKRTNSRIIPVPVQRVGAGYHDTTLYGNISSATAIRESVQSRSSDVLETIKHDIPVSTYDILSETHLVKWPIYTEFLTPFFQASLLSVKDYSHIWDISKSFSQNLSKLPININLSQAVNMLKSKDLTSTRINRCIIHLIMGYTEAMRKDFIKNGYAFYGNILGLKKSSSNLLKCINQNTEIPLINKKADFIKSINAYNINYDMADIMWQLDTKATDLYNCLILNNLGHTNSNDYSTILPII